jgi:hypothetical protein
MTEWHQALFVSDDTRQNECAGVLRDCAVRVLGATRSPVDLEQRFGTLTAAIMDRVAVAETEHDSYRRLQLALHTCAWAYVELVKLQPFVDGNKRTARHVIAWISLRLGVVLNFDPIVDGERTFHVAVQQNSVLPLYAYLAGLVQED